MKYTILSAKVRGEHIITEVELEFPDGKSVIDSVPHFQPQSVADIELGLENRWASEFQKKTATELNAQIVSQLQIGKPIEK